jgi:8-oxo-dGTP pyrophosphatase MutT (NUDIX family)
MRTVNQLTNNKFLNIKEVQDPENHINGYQFAERKGRDSIAFICYDENAKQFLLNFEMKPPLGQFLVTAFGGSIDSNKSLLQIVAGELKEEAGYDAAYNKIKYLGKMFVSTQMNQFCYLYLVLVDKNKQGEREPENEIEKMSSTLWLNLKDIYELEDWKAITIIGLAQNQGII